MNDDRALFYAGYRTARLNKLGCERNRDELVSAAASYFARLRAKRREHSRTDKLAQKSYVPISIRTRLVSFEPLQASPEKAFVRSWWQSRHDEFSLGGKSFTAIFSDGEINTFRRLNETSYERALVAPSAGWDVPELPLCIRLNDAGPERFAVITSESHAVECRRLAAYFL